MSATDVRVILPIDIRDTATTNITPEDPGTQWAAGTYAKGDEVWLASTHLVYRSSVDGNTDDPLVGVESDPKTWVAIRPTNGFAMYSDVIQEQTEFSDEIEVVFDSTSFSLFANSVAVFGAVGTEIQIVAESVTFGGQFFTETISLIDNSMIVNRWQYRYAPFLYRQTAFSTAFTSYPDAVITVRVVNTGSTAKLGKIVIGENLVLGEALAGVSYEPKVTGRTVTTDGKTEYITESVQQIIRGEMKVNTSESGIVAAAIGKKIGATPVPISIDTRYEVLQTLGVLTTRHNWNPALAQRVSFKATSLEGSE